MTTDAAPRALPCRGDSDEPSSRGAALSVIERRALRHLETDELVAYLLAAARSERDALAGILTTALHRVEQAIAALARPSSHGLH